jgi:hypothetical protein
MNMNNTKSSITKKAEKIPAVKHFYDVNAAKKVKKLAKKAMNSNLVKHSGLKPASKKGLIGSSVAAPIVLQIGTFAVLAASGYALWKNRSKIQEFIATYGESDVASAN